MTPEQKQAYFARIGMEVPEKADLETLKQIQQRHIYLVPFENIDIINKTLPISIEFDDLFDKIVTRRRGGICYELNLLLADMLEEIGYEVKRLSAKHPRHGHDFDHAFLMVKVPGSDGEWLTDVGFGDNFRTVLKFDPTLWQGDGRDEYTFREDSQEGYWQLIRRRRGEESLVYTFSLVERSVDDYRDRLEWYTTDEDSRFTQGALVCIERPEGRISLTMDRVLNTFNDERIRSDISSQEEFDAALREIFSIEIAPEETEGIYRDGLGYRRIFAALDESELQEKVIDRAIAIAIGSKAHLRFGHIVEENAKRKGDKSFPEQVQEARERIADAVNTRIDALGVSERLHGGETVVIGANSHIGFSIDEPAWQLPERLVESLVKPFNPDLVICGERGLSRMQYALKGSVSKHLMRHLDCDVLVVRQ